MKKLITLYQQLKRKKNHPRNINKKAFLDHFKVFFKFFLTILLISGMSYFFIGSNYFLLTEVNLKADKEILTANQLVQIAKVPMGKNIFSFSLTEIIEHLKKFPFIDKVEIRRELPNRLSININYYQPIAILELDHGKKNKQYLISQEGEIFREISNQEFYDLPIISGFTYQELTEHISFYKEFYFQAFEFFQKFSLEEINQSIKILGLHYDPIIGFEMLIQSKNSNQDMVVYFGNQNYDQVRKFWQTYLKHLLTTNTWYQEVDLHVPGKVFSRL